MKNSDSACNLATEMGVNARTSYEKLRFIPIESFIRKSSFLNPHPRK